jgi:hypothetical protein
MATWPPAESRPTIASRPRRAGPSLGIRLRVWASSLKLDRRLAEGAAPASSVELALRASQLASARTRQALSTGLTAAVDAAARPRRHPAASAPILAGRVTDAAGPLVCLARDLRAADAPPVRVLAQVSLLLCDGTSSPMYNRACPVSLRDLAQEARATLADRPGETP